MSRDAALRSAISLLSMPAQVRVARTAPLPDGTSLLLGVAARDEAAVAEAVTLTGRQPDFLISAAAFFIEQILLVPEADSYRVLGVSPTANTSELRAHMAMLMKWLHPDVEGVGQKALFAALVTRAWEDLKTPERRHAYDTTRLAKPAAKRHSSRKKMSTRRRALPPAPQPGWMMRALARLLGKDRPTR